MESNKYTIALCGNPNVGKSTLFNAMTGLKQHTGNWTGKTTDCAYGKYSQDGCDFTIIDLPGTYSIAAQSLEEQSASDFLQNGQYDAAVIVCDACSLRRSLVFALQVIERVKKAVVCINLIDEAKRKSIEIDFDKLAQELGVPVIPVCARKKADIAALISGVLLRVKEPSQNIQAHDLKPPDFYVNRAHEICKCAVIYHDSEHSKNQRALDKIVTHRFFGKVFMLALLFVVLFITIAGANYPSRLLSSLFFWFEGKLVIAFDFLHMPSLLRDALVLGVYRVTAWVVAVMLPPMAIFFPLFTLLEDFGYLPRVAFNMDNSFKKCSSCGKQALTMCMGFGCNAAGVASCRIIDSPRERLLAILTNSFMPCNGKFPTLIAVITMFFIGTAARVTQTLLGALMLSSLIVAAIAVTFLVCRILSATLLKGQPSSFALELPPYRRPQLKKVLLSSMFERTLKVLGRALLVSAPAGLLIWLLANISVANVPLLTHLSNFLDPFAKVFGLDGVILLSFVLGLPANEIVFPLMIMCYTQGSALADFALLDTKPLLLANGWTPLTALCVLIICLFHSPCATTILTIKKESRSKKWTALSIALPTLIGLLLCFILSLLAQIPG